MLGSRPRMESSEDECRRPNKPPKELELVVVGDRPMSDESRSTERRRPNSPLLCVEGDVGERLVSRVGSARSAECERRAKKPLRLCGGVVERCRSATAAFVFSPEPKRGMVYIHMARVWVISLTLG